MNERDETTSPAAVPAAPPIGSRPPGWRRATPAPADTIHPDVGDPSTPESAPELSPSPEHSPSAGATSERPAGKVGRRQRGRGQRRFDPVLLLSLLIPLATVGALATVHPASTQEQPSAPGEAPLSRTLLVCPAGLPGSEQVSVAMADPSAQGSLRVTDADPLTVAPGKVAQRQTSGTVVLEGTDDAASGLFALRGDAELGTACQGPRSDVWFTGVGAGPEHTSRLRLVNPDSGPAVADVEVLTAEGTVEVAALRGLAVPPSDETVIDLDAVVPDRHDMSVRVTVPRGRLALSMTDTFAEIGSDVRARSWLAPQRAGARTLHLLGVERGTGTRTLVVANAGTDEARVALKFITDESEFAPGGTEPLRVAPGSTATLDLSRLLRSDAAKGLIGIRLDSEVPVTATLRTVRGSRVVHTVAAPELRRTAATVVPDGGGVLALGGTPTMTDVVVRQRAADGRELESRTVAVAPLTGTRFELSPKARTVVLEIGDQPVRAALVSGRGNPGAVQVLEELPLTSPVPRVRPALQ